MEINPQDIQVDTFNTGSGWIPKFNGVSILHIPTGIRAECDTERSQWANKTKAFEKLISTLNNESDYTKQMELF